jgi:aryl-alcohol dehydrogenase-like predicted oxidoreductase
MRYRRIADGQLEVSAVCLGCWAMAGDPVWGPQRRVDAIEAIQASLGAGINFFDTAEAYGQGDSERLLGEALAGRREQAVIATKVGAGHLDAAGLVAACERSLANLRTDWIDLYYIHWPSRTVPFQETVAAMERLLAAGKVRHLAVSNFGAADLGSLLPHLRPAADQLSYSLLFRAIEFAILPACRAAGVPVTCYSPLMQGLLTGKFAGPRDVPDERARTRHYASQRPNTRHGEAGAERETFAAIAAIRDLAAAAGLDMAAMSLAWLLKRDGVAGVIVGARNRRQALSNAAAAEINLPADLDQQLTEATEPLKRRLGPNPDLWQRDSRIR